MKYIVKPENKKIFGYCFGCGNECNQCSRCNDCGRNCSNCSHGGDGGGGPVRAVPIYSVTISGGGCGQKVYSYY